MSVDFTESITDARLGIKITDYLQSHNLTVEIIGEPPKSALILSTHPTKQEGYVWRQIKKYLHAAKSAAIQSVPVEIIDSWVNIHLKRMIPVYKGDKKKREKTYVSIAKQLAFENTVILNPTGETSGTNDIPPAEDIQMGTYRIIQHLPAGSPIVPAVVFVDGEISPEGTAEPGSTFRVFFGEPYDFPDGYFNGELAPEDFRQRVVDGWKKIADENGLGV